MADQNRLDELLKEIEQEEQAQTEIKVRRKRAEETARRPVMEDDAVNHFIRDFVTPGTPACGLLCALLALAAAVLLLSVGIGKTLLIAVFGVIGAFVGGVPDKSQWLKDLINRLFPPKN